MIAYSGALPMSPNPLSCPAKIVSSNSERNDTPRAIVVAGSPPVERASWEFSGPCTATIAPITSATTSATFLSIRSLGAQPVVAHARVDRERRVEVRRADHLARDD